METYCFFKFFIGVNNRILEHPKGLTQVLILPDLAFASEDDQPQSGSGQGDIQPPVVFQEISHSHEGPGQAQENVVSFLPLDLVHSHYISVRETCFF